MMPAGVTSWLRNAAGTAVAAVLAYAAAPASASSEQPFYADAFVRSPSVSAMAAVGRELFADASLSASGRIACATCHVPARAFGPPDARSVQLGGGGRRHGLRAVPSLAYRQNAPAFTEHFVDDEGDDSVDQGPAGGLMWDGRSATAHDQARLPFFSPFEMANESPAALVARVRDSPYARSFRDTFGDDVFDDQALAFKGVLLALETYQQTPQEFYPYTSKYDAWLRQEAVLSVVQRRGLAVFNDPAKGNCARCHPSGMRDGAFPAFTDFGYAAIGVPRNKAIPANAKPAYFDLGLCGPLRTDLRDRREYCGLFRTPSLRNVALRHVFFHNGVIHRLDDAVRFYAERDTQPQKWYPRAADGSVAKFDDLPGQYHGNVDVQAPFGGHAGGTSRLTGRDINDIVAFLSTLTDGYTPAQ